MPVNVVVSGFDTRRKNGNRRAEKLGLLHRQGLAGLAASHKCAPIYGTRYTLLSAVDDMASTPLKVGRVAPKRQTLPFVSSP